MNILKVIGTNTWDGLQDSFNFLWSKISPILLPLIFILAFLGIGLWIAGYLGDKIGTLVKKSKIDALLDTILDPILKLTGTKINSSNIIIGSIKWFLTALILIAALNLADMHSVVSFINQAIGYLPNIFVAALILIAGSLLANLAATIVGFVLKGNFAATAKVAVNVLALIAALSKVVTPLVGSLSHFIGQLSLSKMQADVLFIGVIVLVLLASKNTVAKIVENLYKT